MWAGINLDQMRIEHNQPVSRLLGGPENQGVTGIYVLQSVISS